MKWSFVFDVLGNLALDRTDAGEHILVRVDDAFGMAGRTGGKNDLQRIVLIPFRYGQKRGSSHCIGPVLKREFWNGRIERCWARVIVQDQAGADVRNDGLYEGQGAGRIHRNSKCAVENAAEEGSHPGATILAPE